MSPHTRYVVLFAVGTLVAMLALHRAARALLDRGAKVNTARRLLTVGELLGVLLVGSAVVKHNVRGEAFVADLAIVHFLKCF